MKNGIPLLFLILSASVHAQNLVPNSSFEDTTGCPSQIGQVNKSDGWVNWGVTPDFFHSCANITSPLYGVPQNWRGYQPAHFGQAYMGLFTYNDLSANHREFLGRALLQPMIPGQTYFVSLWVCRAEQLLCSHSTNNIGVRFTTVSNYSLTNPDTALNNAHVFSASVISDTSNWIQVSGSFTADSAYTHIGIGNYFDDVNTTVILGDPTSNYAYFLIDDVCVSADPLFCNNETATNEAPLNSFKVYPNPSNLNITIDSNNPLDGTVHIYNALGKIVLPSMEIKSGIPDFNIDISSLPDGIYFVAITGTDFSSIRKFIKITN